MNKLIFLSLLLTYISCISRSHLKFSSNSTEITCSKPFLLMNLGSLGILSLGSIYGTTTLDYGDINYVNNDKNS